MPSLMLIFHASMLQHQAGRAKVVKTFPRRGRQFGKIAINKNCYIASISLNLF